MSKCAARVDSLSRQLALMDQLQQPVWIFDIDKGRVAWGNASSLVMWQADSLDELLERDMGAEMSATVARRLRQYQSDFLRDENIKFKESWTLYPNGAPTTQEVIYSAARLDNGSMGMLCEAVRERETDAESLRSAEALLHTSVMITLYSASGEPLYRNPAARHDARSADEMLQQHFTCQTALQQLLDASQVENKVIASVHTANGTRWHDITALRCLDAVSGKHAWLFSEVDVTLLKETEERAQFLADHDTLTQLPNRNYVTSEFEHHISSLLRAGESGALIFIDLDRFKDVNDSLGHCAGDQLLIAVADRLRSIIRNEKTVARLGGDEFLVLLGPLDDESDLQRVAERIKEKLSEPIFILGREICVTPSMGISRFPMDGQTIHDLMRKSDLAMYRTKDNGRNSFNFFSQEMSDSVQTRIALESELALALKQDQMITYFQPRAAALNNKIVGAEALVRWNHPERGLISPDTFIPLCEETGLISTLGKQVFEQSVKAQKAWADQGHDLRISVNLSAVQFTDASLIDDFLLILKNHDVNADRIEFEITESVLLGNDMHTVNQLEALVAHGFTIAIDDFGTGYSNLAYIHQYPIACLKIDRSFIQSMDTVRPITQLIVSMAQLFSLNIVAEGVETEEQLQFLQSLECQEYQGYLLQKPLPYEAFTKLLTDAQMRHVNRIAY
ncbi:MAG: EAL domain-containing protein [Granulosicoccus sp.]|nr:EAL domain-containing protein [Granulosicoccus sp.]